MTLEIGVARGDDPNSLAGRIGMVRERIAHAAQSSGRSASAVRLLAVTKRHPRETVLAAIACGVDAVGENYAQEAREKYAALPPIAKHFIGHVQTNKARAIVETFDVVQSIDRLDAGRAIARAAQRCGKRVRTLVQINISPTDRYGIAPEDAPALAERLRADEGLDVDGVMAIGPATSDPSALARAFERAAATFAQVGGDTLSIGMSGDYELAVQSGSTMVRLGTVLFGARA